MNFDYYTCHNGNSRICLKGEMGFLDRNVWNYEGCFTIDEIPAKEFPIYVSEAHGSNPVDFYDIMEVRDKSVVVNSEDGFRFFVPKASLFRNGKINLRYWHLKAMKDRDEWVNKVRGLSK
jgi:hypothetical protein